MKYLLDTHAFLWFGMGEKLFIGEEALRAFEDPNNEIYLHNISLWEITIKTNLGKLKLPIPLKTLLQSAQQNSIDLLSIDSKSLEAYEELPLHHRDPFDRLLISTAIAHDMVILTRDSAFKDYEGLKLVW